MASDLVYLQSKCEHYAALVLTTWDNLNAHEMALMKIKLNQTKTKSKTASKKLEEELSIENHEIDLTT